MRVSNREYLSDFVEARSYKNGVWGYKIGVGSHLVELFDRCACVSFESSSKSIGEGK